MGRGDGIDAVAAFEEPQSPVQSWIYSSHTMG